MLNLPDHMLQFEVIYSTRRTLGITVNGEGKVIARAPQGISLQRVDGFISEHSDWIRKQQRKADERKQILPAKLAYADGETLYFLGNAYRLKVMIGRGGAGQIQGETVIVTVKAAGDTAAVERAVMRWYRQQADIVFEERLALHFARVRHWGVMPPPLVIRRMKTRWGSCTSKGKITLSLRLMQAPIALIDYVILHELCHLREMNHGAGFYRLMAEICPNWRALRAALAQTPTNW